MSHFTTLAQAAAVAALVMALPAAPAADLFPLQAKVSKVADGPLTLGEYSLLPKASKPWSICVSFPHLKDPMFLALNYGMVEEAKRQGVRMQTMDAGGYTGLNTQISQVEDCVAGGADAVVLVGIARDGMNNLLTQLKAKNIPVVDAINGVSSKDTGARVLTNPRDEGFNAGAYLAKKYPAGKSVKVAWMPGPAGAGFVEAFNSGFLDGIKGSGVTIVETKYGDISKEAQARLVEDILQTHKDVEYIVGTAVMVEATVPLFKARKIQDKVKLVSIYTTPGVYQYLKNGDIEAAGVAPVVPTGRIMLDEAVRLLEKKVDLTDVYTISKVYTKDEAKSLDPGIVLAPPSFKPVFKVGK